jgi:hypothetical protein
MAEHIYKLTRLHDASLNVTVILTPEYKIRQWIFLRLIFIACWMATRILGCSLEYDVGEVEEEDAHN